MIFQPAFRPLPTPFQRLATLSPHTPLSVGTGPTVGIHISSTHHRRGSE